MKRILYVLFIAALLAGAYWYFQRDKGAGGRPPKQEPIALKKHSAAFNQKVDEVIDAYIKMKDALVNDDTSIAKQSTMAFMNSLDSIPVDELKSDAAVIIETVKANITDIKSNATSLLSQSDIMEMRKDFRMVTDMMYPGFFKAINYEGRKLYLQFCPMAFGEDQGANWLSLSSEIMNPYMGHKHPTYKSGMLHCGEVKDSIR